MLPSLHLLRLGHDTGCLNMDIDATQLVTAHPSCEDSQLFVLEGRNADDTPTFSAVNYIRLKGSKFIILPVENEHIPLMTDDITATCLADSMNQFIAQSSLTSEPPQYRSLGESLQEKPSNDYCPIVARFRPDGSIIFTIKFEYIDDQEDTVVILNLIREAIKQQIAKADNAGIQATLQAGLAGLTFDIETDPPKALEDVLKTLVICAQNKMSALIGMFPEGASDEGAFVVTFKGLKLDDEGALKVPVLSLVHEDTLEEQVHAKDLTKLYEHLNAVRSSYWICTATKKRFNTIDILHSEGHEYINSLAISQQNLHNKRERGGRDHFKLTKLKEEYEAGKQRVGLYSAGEINGTYDEAENSATRQIAENEIIATLTRPKSMTMWPQMPRTNVTVRVSNLALAKTGSKPITSVKLDYYMQYDGDINENAKAVRKNLSLLEVERLFEQPIDDDAPVDDDDDASYLPTLSGGGGGGGDDSPPKYRMMAWFGGDETVRYRSLGNRRDDSPPRYRPLGLGGDDSPPRYRPLGLGGDDYPSPSYRSLGNRRDDSPGPSYRSL